MALKLSSKHSQQLISYLMDHESDIAHDMNDFGELAELFEKCMGRKPEAIKWN